MYPSLSTQHTGPPPSAMAVGRRRLRASFEGTLASFVISSLMFMVILTNLALHWRLPGYIDMTTPRTNLARTGEDSGAGGHVRRNLLPPEWGAPVGADGGGDDDGNSEDEILRVLRQAGVEVDDEILATLPKWSDLTSMYGPMSSGPTIVGLDTCARFRSMHDPADAYIGPAGIFNTGTNLLAKLLNLNCAIPAKRARGRGAGMRWQVPWGKHNPVGAFRLHNVAGAEVEDPPIDQTAVLPVVTTKDPYGWMGSMCRHPYAASWDHRTHCPNLVANPEDQRRGIWRGGPDGDGAVPVTVSFGPRQRNVTRHSSLAGLWNDWYGEYFDEVDFPRLIVRFEDIMLKPQEVVTKVCQCGGGEIKDTANFVMVADSAKGKRGSHQGSSGLVDALKKYGNPETRVSGMTDADLAYARANLRSDLMDAFGYVHPISG